VPPCGAKSISKLQVSPSSVQSTPRSGLIDVSILIPTGAGIVGVGVGEGVLVATGAVTVGLGLSVGPVGVGVRVWAAYVSVALAGGVGLGERISPGVGVGVSSDGVDAVGVSVVGSGTGVVVSEGLAVGVPPSAGQMVSPSFSTHCSLSRASMMAPFSARSKPLDPLPPAQPRRKSSDPTIQRVARATAADR
jgi:hypothetical protein